MYLHYVADVLIVAVRDVQTACCHQVSVKR